MLDKAELRMKYFGTTTSKGIFAALSQRVKDHSNNAPWDWTKWVKTKFPFYAPEHELPAPIPSPEEIAAVRGTENDLTRENRTTFDVFRVSEFYAVKMSHSPVIFQEAENLLFLQEHCQIRTPKIYAAFVHQGVDCIGTLARRPGRYSDASQLPPLYYLVTEYIKGKNCLPEVFASLTVKAKESFCRKLSSELRLLRAVQPPTPAYYGRVYHQGWFPGFPQTQHAPEPGQFQGPYETHEEWFNAIYKTSEYICCYHPGDDFGPGERYLLESFKKTMARASGTKPVLTHMDLKLPNVMVIEKEGTKDEVDIVIIDWEWMGWMPAYMEPARTLGSVPVPWNYANFWELVKDDMETPYVDTALYVREFLDATGNNWA